jgi:hypothetical protein
MGDSGDGLIAVNTLMKENTRMRLRRGSQIPISWIKLQCGE